MTSTSKMSSTRNTSLDKSYIYRKKKPPVVELHWVDAQTSGGSEWMEYDETKSVAKSKLPCMFAVGYLVHEDDTQVAIVSMLGPNESSQVHKIPKSMIIMRRSIDGSG